MIYNEITLDIINLVSNVVVNVKQYDANTNILIVNITNNDIPYDITDATVKMFFNGIPISSVDATIIDAVNGIVNFELTNTMLTSIGVTPCYLVITKTGSNTPSDTFYLNVADYIHQHTSSEIVDFDSEVRGNEDVSANTGARHIHSNITVLNNTSASFTTEEKSKLLLIADNANYYMLPVATEVALGGIKSGDCITIDENGNVTINDDSHNHIISNVDGLQDVLNNKEPSILKNTGFNLNLETDIANIKMNGIQSVGILTTIARADHIHPTDNSLVKKDTKITLPASTSSTAYLNLPHGINPTVPVDGDIWTTTDYVYVRMNGTSRILWDNDNALYANSSLVTQATAEAGTNTSAYFWSPERVAQAIAAQVASNAHVSLTQQPDNITETFLNAKMSGSIADFGGLVIDQGSLYRCRLTAQGTGTANGNVNLIYEKSADKTLGTGLLQFKGFTSVKIGDDTVYHTGNIDDSAINLCYASGIKGSATGVTNLSYINFYESDGATR